MKAREIEKDDLDEELVDNVNGDNSLSALCLVSDENKDPFLNCDFCAFKLQELQGKGSYGEVWRAKCKDETVALKIINSSDDVLRGIFYHEVEAMRNMNHPNIIGIMGACTHPVYAIIMEFMSCGSLDMLLHHSKDVSYKADHVFHWASQCADAIEYIHWKGFAHTDIKPANLLLDDDCHLLKLADFGTVGYMNSDAEYRQGSAAWMAPEVFAGSKPSEKSDYYSFGILLWEMITRKRPYSECKNAEEILWNVYAGMRPPRIEDIPSQLMRMIESCWDASPQNRPSIFRIQRVIAILHRMYPNYSAPLIKSGLKTASQQDTSGGNGCDVKACDAVTTANGGESSALAVDIEEEMKNALREKIPYAD